MSTSRSRKTTPPPAEPSEQPTPPAETVTPAAPPADETMTDAPVPADLIKAAAANALEMLKGHTDNSAYHLATKNAPEWAPSMGEYIGAQVDGTKLYTGPVRPELEGEPGKWETTNLLPKTAPADVRAKYATLPRLEAAARHAQGCAAMGLETSDPAMTFQPDRTALYEISVSESPIATARRLAGKAAVSISGVATADGLTRKQKSELDTLMRAVLKKAEKAHNGGTAWHALLLAAAEEYGDKAAVAILASVERITKGRADSGKWIAAFAKVLRRGEEKPAAEANPEETAPADNAADQK
ncbi:hypothetical protein AB0K18_42980 [Nonomuraea sp. NPDC049421]|uniref:hypothetical protein n=1 Tax=Nonomuraea sp. NPDC049421 TaxID=3155275 RepID=UPI003431893C